MAGFTGRVEAGIISRGQGHSASHAAAYRARCSIEDERTGRRFDYSRKNAECLFAGIYAPKNAPEWTTDRAQLWNHVEAFETRKDSQLARELLISLPHELTPDQSRQALQDFIRENFTRKGLIADLAVHAPHSHGDERNIHAHLMVVLRKLDGSEFEAKKPRQSKAENVAQLDGWKRQIEHHLNRRLVREGFEPYYDVRSNAERGIDRLPSIKLGKHAAALERKGIETDLGDVNREIAAENVRRAANENTPDELTTTLEAVREREAEPQRGSMDNTARHALDDLARIDPIGTALRFGHYAGDHLKSVEQMRHEWAMMVNGGRPAGMSADAEPTLSAEPVQSRDLALPDPAPEPQEAVRTLSGPIALPNQPEPLQPPEIDRGGAFQRIGAWLRQVWEPPAEPAPVPKVETPAMSPPAPEPHVNMPPRRAAVPEPQLSPLEALMQRVKVDVPKPTDDRTRSRSVGRSLAPEHDSDDDEEGPARHYHHQPFRQLLDVLGVRLRRSPARPRRR